jgi:hypothetical protein
MRIACRITKVRDTLSEYVIIITFPRRQWNENAPQYCVYTYIACVVRILYRNITRKSEENLEDTLIGNRDLLNVNQE